ncbi:MFS transporter [Demequina sediminicola]|uniref:MFS transporter n=1 Tax=Demequina sediminicola TaxID=1095026 RepID=UPI0007856EC7|nr:MFS transporter [Demequina sediminicola]
MTRNPATQRALVAAVQIMALAVWFSVSAVIPGVQAEFSISSAAAVWLTAAVQLGFVAGALVSTITNLADRMPIHLLLGSSAALAALSTSLLAWLAHDLATMIALRFVTGVFLAGVYPTGMKLMASWAPPQQRGLSMGLLIGALTVGSALPNLIGGLADLPWRSTLQITAVVGLVGAITAFTLVRSGPYLAASRTTLEPRYFIHMFRQRRPLLINVGYFGHMWELYALWTWIAVFVARSAAEFSGSGQVMVFVTMGIGGLAGCLIGGWAADRYGRKRAAIVALTVSGACCVMSPVAFNANAVMLTVLCAVWGASVIADSGVFSTALSESVEPEHVGTALTGQTAVGFALTVASIQLVPLVAEVTGWQYALVILALGPVVGVAALRQLPRSDQPAAVEKLPQK